MAAKEILPGGARFFQARVEGNSMAPTLPAGSLILIESLGPQDWTKLRIGDIAVINKDPDHDGAPAMVAHRLRGFDPQRRLLLQGDGIAFPDAAPLDPDRIMGRVVEWVDEAPRQPTTGHPRRWRPRPITMRLMVLTMRLPGGRIGGSIGLRLRRLLKPFTWQLLRGPFLSGAGVSSASKPPLQALQQEPPLKVSATLEKPKGNERGSSLQNDTPIRVEASLTDRFEDQQIGDDWALHDRKTGAVHMLNSSAGRIWQLLREGLDDEAIVAKYRQEFAGLSLAEAQADVHKTKKMLGLDTNWAE